MRNPRSKADETTLGDALRGSIGPLMRQIRKYGAMKAFVAALPEELAGLAAPYDIRLAPSQEAVGQRGGGSAKDQPIGGGAAGVRKIALERGLSVIGTADGADAADDAPGITGVDAAQPGSAAEDLHTMFIYVASKTVETVIEQRKRRIIEAINGRLPQPIVEELRYEIVAPQRIARQLNILGLRPD